MRKLFRRILTVFMLMSIGIIVNAQEIQKSEKEHLYKISETEGLAPVKGLRSEPMIIGPTLYDQMGVVGNYYGLSIKYTYGQFEKYSGASADDFVIPTDESWDIRYVRSIMYSPTGLDSISSYLVSFYEDAAGKPGTLKYELIDQTDVTTEVRAENPNMFDLTVKLDKNISFAAGTYWINVQPVTEVESLNSWGDPSVWVGQMLQVQGDPINNQGHIINEGTGFFNMPNWGSMEDYWILQQGVDYGYYNFNFALFGEELDNDLAVTTLVTPETDADLSAAETVTVVIQNHGKNAISADQYKVHFRLNAGDWSELEDGEAITSGSEIYYTFHSSVDMAVKGVYNFEVEVVYAEDENVDNNNLVKVVENFGKLYPAVPDAKVTYTTCEGTFTDHGGLDNVYVGYSRDTVVFLPGQAGHRIRLEFYDTQMSGAYPFRFYNGSDTDAPELGDWEALNSSEGIYTQEIHGLVLEGVNAEGAITIIVPGFDINAGTNNFLANVSCVKNENIDFEVTGIGTSKPYSWETETIELTAELKNRGLNTGAQLVTFMVEGVDLETVSSTLMKFGEVGYSEPVTWTPATAGTYTITAKVPADEGANVEEKEFSFDHVIYPMGYLIEGFEQEKYPPEGWENRIVGGTSRYFIWYNDRDHWEGKWSVTVTRDTLITPKLDIQETDTLEFIYSAGFFGGTCDIMYAPTLNGPWKTAHTVAYGLPFAKNYKASLKKAVGANYIAFVAAGGNFDYVRAPKVFIGEFDLEAANLAGAIDPQVNEETTYDFKIRNMGSGSLTGTDYEVKLWKEIDGVATELASIAGVDIPLANYHTFTFTHTFSSVETGNVYATIAYANDVELSNNTSEALDLVVIKAGVEYALAGDINSEEIDRATFAGYYGNYAENIYHKDSLNIKGEISGISIYYTNYYAENVPLEIFIGETDVDHLEEGFLSTSAMNRVLKGSIEVEFNQFFTQLYIPFDEPYLYSGEKNLAMAIYRPAYNGEFAQPSITLQATARDAKVHRWHGMQIWENDMDVSDPDVINAVTGQLYSYVPNVMFYVKTTEMDASLVGTVTDETAANLEGVTLSIDGFANTAKTDADGKYRFPVMPYGTIDILAEFYGYYDKSDSGTLVAATETVVDFTLKELVPVDITGKLVGDDFELPIEGVDVYMTGYEAEYFATTDADGIFLIDEAYGDKDYEIAFSHPQYESQTLTISPTSEGLDMGAIIMNEIEAPAFNIIAELNAEGVVDLSWQTPYTGKEALVDPTLGVEFGSYWYNEPDENVQLGNLFKVKKPGTVTSLELSNFAWQGASSAELYLRFYNKDREEILKPVSFMMPDSTVDWFNVEVPNFTYTEDFYVMIHWNRIHQQTSAIMSHLHDDNVAYLIDGGGNWMLLTDVVGPTHSGAFSLRANVLEEGTKASKALVSYDLWRTELENSSDPSLWTKMNTEPIAGTGVEVTYSDATFDAAAAGYYMYVVQAEYTATTSPYAYSNDINKGLYSTATVNVTANNEADITGALVTLANKNGASINTYFAVVANGKVEFSRVLKGNYELEITKGAAYEVYSEDLEVADASVFPAELIEHIFTPTMLTIATDEENRNVAFSWGLGDQKYYQLDDGTAEQALGAKVDGDAELGNLFEVKEGGQIVSIDLMGASYGTGDEKGKVSLVFYDAKQEIIGKTSEFIIEVNDDGSLQNIPVNFIEYSGSFYAMIKYSSEEPLEAAALAVDTDENPGNAYYYDADLGFTQLANLGYYGNFILRANVLVNSKKSTVTTLTNSNSGTKVTEKIMASEIDPIAVKSGTRSVLSYNVFLNDLTTAVASGVTSQSFLFTEADHLQLEGTSSYTAGVQAVFATGNSIVVTKNFSYTTGVMDELDAQMVMYPNPASDLVTITHTKNSTIEIYNAVGTLVKTRVESTAVSSINVANLANGTYIIKVKFAEGNVFRSLIINR